MDIERLLALKVPGRKRITYAPGAAGERHEPAEGAV
jgi:hypothetical protein